MAQWCEHCIRWSSVLMHRIAGFRHCIQHGPVARFTWKGRTVHLKRQHCSSMSARAELIERPYGEQLTQAIGLAQTVARLQRQDNDMSVKSFN